MINYKIISRGNPSKDNGQEKKFYASIEYSGKIETDAILRFVESTTAVSQVDLISALYAIKKALINYLESGFIVKLDAIGTFYPSIHSMPSNKARDVKSNKIKRLTINYRPDPKIIEAINNDLITFKKSNQ